MPLSPRFGFGCCDECSDRLAREAELEDEGFFDWPTPPVADVEPDEEYL